MRYTIKFLNKLSEVLPVEVLVKLDEGAGLHRRFSNIEFRVIDVDDESRMLTIQTKQGKHVAENFADEKMLIKQTKDLFSPALKGWKIYVQATAHKESPVTLVDPAWIQKKMDETGAVLKDLESDMGIEKSNISPWLSGAKPLSQVAKAMFYYYFLYRKGKK